MTWNRDVVRELIETKTIHGEKHDIHDKGEADSVSLNQSCYADRMDRIFHMYAS